MNNLNGALSYQDYKVLIEKKNIHSDNKMPQDLIQPASIDLRLGKMAYEISASFLTINETVERKLKDYQINSFDISNGFLFKKNKTYIIEIQEILNLDNNFSGKCNPKSSTGRLDILCRTITDFNSEYEIINAGYKGKIYIEVTTKTFDVIFTSGDKLNQLRLRKGNTEFVDDNELKTIHLNRPILFNKKNEIVEPLMRNGIKISADIAENKKIIAYTAKKDAPEIKFNKIHFYEIEDYWHPVFNQNNKSLIIQPNEFYILKSKEKIRILSDLAAEMIPYDTDIGEFRVHYAGFFDPGFGCDENGSHAVLEIKTYEVPFAIEDGQNVARLMFEKLIQIPDKLYGSNIKSNYQNQNLALSKHFRLIDNI